MPRRKIPAGRDDFSVRRRESLFLEHTLTKIICVNQNVSLQKCPE